MVVVIRYCLSRRTSGCETPSGLTGAPRGRFSFVVSSKSHKLVRLSIPRFFFFVVV